MQHQAPRNDAPAAESPTTRRGPGRPRKMPLDQQRPAILEAAAEVFGEHGLEGATSSEIAVMAGTARPTVYELFGSKPQLFVAAVDWAIDRVLEKYAERMELSDGLDGRQRCVAHVRFYLDLLQEDPAALRLLHTAAGTGDPSTVEAARCSRRRFEESVGLDVLANPDVVAAGGMDPDVAVLVGAMVLAAVEAAALRERDVPRRTPDELAEIITDALLPGVVHLAHLHGAIELR